ncbi:TIR domain-containing adapter molecule 1 [Etheostoma spectabile]|uniref:TIR domain-containing adapter molecule 1 n=1 Tax=Etheostoma spectabile TaxID=54343 RepID=UPI0013AFD7D6|nr:TIR domain-containing adapter molecule 1-like [Etheostoma spectabile]
MNQGGQENQGTGLRDVLDILVKVPPQRLLSLTFQLGESPEDNIVHALCLILLQKEERALNKLQMLKDNSLANHLAEKWQMSGGKYEDFADNCGHFQEFTGESLALLARLFKVLSDQRLCDPPLRNLAYKRALSSDIRKTSKCKDLEYDLLREEAKNVCGPQFEWICSPKDLKSGSYHDPPSSLGEGNTNLKVAQSQDPSERAHNLPSPLQATSSMPSYPTHLEISIPPTASFQDDKITPETSDESKPSEQSQPKSSEPPKFGAKKPSKMDGTLAAEGNKMDSRITQCESLNQTTKPTAEPNFALPTATNLVLPEIPVPNEPHASKEAEEEDEPTFYTFVILHAPEDADVADSMRERLETLMRVDGEGATFSGDFAEPGKSTLRCVEDAINNSAFTLLLLTCNFNTRMLDVEMNSALINSIEKKHKYNTVVPLLPLENCLPKESIPLVLQTLNPLRENKNLERQLNKFLSPAKIKNQRKIWTAEQKVKTQMERQETLKNLNQYQKQLFKELGTAQLLEKESLSLLMAQQQLLFGRGVPPEQVGGDGRVRWPQQQQPNIHIENAKYIMIGNDSQMTVDFGGGADKEDSIPREEEQ